MQTETMSKQYITFRVIENSITVHNEKAVNKPGCFEIQMINFHQIKEILKDNS